jgi:hypothetical protein
MKLEEFRLESYDERMVLVIALAYYQSRNPDMYPEAVEAVANRLSATECQRGGCSYCGGEGHEEYEEEQV